MKHFVCMIVVAFVFAISAPVFAQDAAPTADQQVVQNSSDDQTTPAPKKDWKTVIKECEPSSVGEAIFAYAFGTLICAAIFALAHWLGSFIDPQYGCVLCVAYLVYEVYNVGVQIYCGCWLLPVITVAAVATAAYFHFTKTMAVA